MGVVHTTASETEAIALVKGGVGRWLVHIHPIRCHRVMLWFRMVSGCYWFGGPGRLSRVIGACLAAQLSWANR